MSAVPIAIAALRDGALRNGAQWSASGLVVLDSGGETVARCRSVDEAATIATTVNNLPGLLDEVERGRAREAYWRARWEERDERTYLESLHSADHRRTLAVDSHRGTIERLFAAEIAIRALGEAVPT